MSFLSMIFGPAESEVAHPKTVLDMVTYAAGLVSNSDDINPLVDKVRLITSKLSPGETPSINENKELVAIYLQIEEYLTTKEVLRTFTREGLRSRLDPGLQAMISSAEVKD